MKAKLFVSLMLASGLLIFNYTLASRADGGDGGDGQQCQNQDEDNNGDIDGNESLNAVVVLVPTTNAPAGAKGVAKLEAENDNGVQTNVTLKIITFGLPAGDYDLSAILKSDGSTNDLGIITISCMTNSMGDNQDENDDDQGEDHQFTQTNSFSNDDQENENDNEDGDHNGGCSCSNAVFRTESDVQLPPGLDPMNIAQIILSDTSGNPLLVGDFVNATNGSCVKFKANIHVTADVGAPQAKGTALVQSIAKKGSHKDRFTMIASGVAPNSTFNVEINGTQVGTVTSNKKGKVLVRKLPANLMNHRRVRLTDSQGNTAASAKF